MVIMQGEQITIQFTMFYLFQNIPKESGYIFKLNLNGKQLYAFYYLDTNRHPFQQQQNKKINVTTSGIKLKPKTVKPNYLYTPQLSKAHR